MLRYTYEAKHTARERKYYRHHTKNWVYVPEGQDERTGEFKFYRSIDGRRYPRFHIYCRASDELININLHLDQKQPSYKGTSAHSGEYDGALVEQEAQRIKNTLL